MTILSGNNQTREMDVTDFDRAGTDELLNNDAILQPTKKNDDYVTFCKGDFEICFMSYRFPHSLFCNKLSLI